MTIHSSDTLPKPQPECGDCWRIMARPITRETKGQFLIRPSRLIQATLQAWSEEWPGCTPAESTRRNATGGLPALCWEHRGLRVPENSMGHPADFLHLLKLTGTRSSRNAFQQPWMRCICCLSQGIARFSHLYFCPVIP